MTLRDHLADLKSLYPKRGTMKAYVKAIAALLGAVSTWGVTAATDGGISGVEWFGLAGALATVLAVYALPNSPSTG